MTAKPAAIDLGVYSSGSQPDAERLDRPWPGWSRWRRSRGWRWLSAALVVLLALPLAGAAAPQPPALEPLWTVPRSAGAHPGTMWSRYAADGHSLYLAVPIPGSQWRLIAYRLEDGAVRWQTSFDGLAHEVGVQVVDGVPLVTTRGRFPAHTNAYDPDTGQLRWHHPGYPAGAADAADAADAAAGDGRLLLREDQPVAEPDREPAQLPAHEYTVVDLTTGHPAWSLGLDAGGQVRLHGRPGGRSGLVTLAGDGRLTRYQLGTGDVTATAETDYRAEESLLSASDGLVVVQRTSGRPAGATGYDAGTLAPRWRIPADRVYPCGAQVCAAMVGGAELRVLDPVTGSVRWSRSCAADGEPSENCVLSATVFDREDRWWLVRSVTPQGADARSTEQVTSWQVEAGTGRRIAELGGWRPTWRLAGPTLGAVRLAGEATPDEEPRRLWLGRVRRDPSGVEVLGSIDMQWWQPHGVHMLTWDEGEGLRVWRLR